MQNGLLKLQKAGLQLCEGASALIRDERGQDLVEYAIMCALVAVVALAASSNLSGIISGAFSAMGVTVNSAIGIA